MEELYLRSSTPVDLESNFKAMSLENLMEEFVNPTADELQKFFTPDFLNLEVKTENEPDLKQFDNCTMPFHSTCDMKPELGFLEVDMEKHPFGFGPLFPTETSFSVSVNGPSDGVLTKTASGPASELIPTSQDNDSTKWMTSGPEVVPEATHHVEVMQPAEEVLDLDEFNRHQKQPLVSNTCLRVLDLDEFKRQQQQEQQQQQQQQQQQPLFSNTSLRVQDLDEYNHHHQQQKQQPLVSNTCLPVPVVEQNKASLDMMDFDSCSEKCMLVDGVFVPMDSRDDWPLLTSTALPETDTEAFDNSPMILHLPDDSPDVDNGFNDYYQNCEDISDCESVESSLMNSSPCESKAFVIRSTFAQSSEGKQLKTSMESSKKRRRKRTRKPRLCDNPKIKEDTIRKYERILPRVYQAGRALRIHHFMIEMFRSEECSDLYQWMDRKENIFRIMQPDIVQTIYHHVKGNKKGDYETFARAIRHSREKQAYIAPSPTKMKKVYQLTPAAINHYREVTGEYFGLY